MGNKVALITGGNRGIGASICEILGKNNFFVYLNARSKNETAEAVLQSIREHGGNGKIICFDVSDPASVQQALLSFEHDHLDILVNNAGILKDNLTPSIELEDWNKILNTNYFGAKNVYETFKHKFNPEHSVVVNMGSISGVKPKAGQGAYAVSKAMLIEWTKSLAKTEDHAKRFFCISPGPVATDMIKKAPWYKQAGAFKWIPLQRFAEPDEIGEMVLEVSRVQCPLKNGTNIVTDGGFTQTSQRQ